MKIKLLACVAVATILSSCTDENQITPKNKVSNLKGPTELHGIA